MKLVGYEDDETGSPSSFRSWVALGKENYDMSERLTLVGDKEQRIVQALKYAGWYPGRNVDIAKIENYYSRFGMKISTKAKNFFREYSGIMGRWYIDVFNLEYAADFEFELFPYPKSHAIDVVDFMYDDAEYNIKSAEYESVLDFAPEEENLVMIGEIGYYYPARVWIGESGKLYATHDYEDDVFVFDSVIKLIEHELKGREFTSVAMKLHY